MRNKTGKTNVKNIILITSMSVAGGILGSLIASAVKDRIPKTLKVKYFHDLSKNPDFVLEKNPKGDWIDLRAARQIVLNEGDRIDIPLGVAMKLPKGYEALLLPRSSTCRKYNIHMENSMGVIDNSFCGEEDQWGFRAIAIEDSIIPEGTRIAQFRIIKSQPKLNIVTVKKLSKVSRGAFGSTGDK